MPIYMVRWPNLSMALVRAADETHLLTILDEIGDPFSCRWKVYNGPLFLDIEIDAKVRYDEEGPERDFVADDITLDGEGDRVDFCMDKLKVSLPYAESAEEMWLEIRKFCFPHVDKVMNKEQDDEGTVDSEVLRAALAKDLNSNLKGPGKKADDLTIRRYYRDVYGPRGLDEE